MWRGPCGLCGSEQGAPRGRRPPSDTLLPVSGRDAAELLAEMGHALPQGAPLCALCLDQVLDLDLFLDRAARARRTIEKRAEMKLYLHPNNEVRHESTEGDESTNGTTESPIDPPVVAAATKGPANDPASARALSGARRASVGQAEVSSHQPGHGDGEGDKKDSAGDVSTEKVPGTGLGGDGDSGGGGVRPVEHSEGKAESVEASGVKMEPVKDNGVKMGQGEASGAKVESMEASGVKMKPVGAGVSNETAGGSGDETAGGGRDATTGISGSNTEWERESEDAGRDRAGKSKARHRRRVADRPTPAGKPRDWNERWRKKALEGSSRAERFWSSQLDMFREAVLTAEMEKQAETPLVGPAARIKVEPGTEPAGEGCSSGIATPKVPDGVPPARPPFGVGRKVVTKQMDGSAALAVKMVHQDRRGQPKVRYVDYKTAVRRAERIERLHGVAEDALSNNRPATESQRPAKKPRRPRVMSKPGGPAALPSEVAWMAAGPADQTWLPTEGAVHAVLDVQEGEDWVDAIVRSEAAAENGWPDGAQAHGSAPTAGSKRGPPE